MKYAFIQDHARRYPVKLLCRLLSVQRSAYYDWRDRPCKVIPPEELALRRRMKVLFAVSRGSLGSRTMTENLRQEGFEIGRYKTRRLMKQLRLRVKQKRKYKVTTDSKHSFPVAENVLNREFSPSAPDQVWGTDITYLWTQQGTDKLTRRRGLALLDRDIMALYVDSSAHSERVLRSKDARYSHLPVAEFVNLSVPPS